MPALRYIVEPVLRLALEILSNRKGIGQATWPAKRRRRRRYSGNHLRKVAHKGLALVLAEVASPQTFAVELVFKRGITCLGNRI